MHIVTSFAPGREERQLYCLSTWQKYGVPIVAVQTTAEMDRMKSMYKEVRWVESFSDRPLVKEMADVAKSTDGPILLINSDISIKNTLADFASDWMHPIWQSPNMLRIGIRWDRREDGTKRLTKYGIDAFLITPEIADSLPELGYRIGKPTWDYWIVMHCHQLGYQISAKKSLGLIHAEHEREWTEGDHAIGIQLLTDHYGVKQKEATRTIQRLTGRK